MNQRLIRLIPILLILTLCACNGKAVPTAGVIEGNRYESKFLGLSCELAEQFTVESAEEIQKVNGFSSDTSSEVSRDNAEVLYDFYALNRTTGSSLTVIYENLPVRYGKQETFEDYLHAAEQRIKDSLADLALTSIKVTRTTEPFAGEPHPVFHITADIDGTVTLFETMVCIEKGDYMAVITATTVGVDDTESLLEAFKRVE